MSNPGFVRGLDPVGPLLRVEKYQITSGSAYFIGDPVVMGTGGKLALATAGSDNSIQGAVVGLTDANGAPVQYIAATDTDGYALIANHPDQLFAVVGGSAGTKGAVTDIGGNWSLLSAAGSTVNYRSQWYVDDSAASTSGATRQVRVVGVAPMPGNAAGTAYCEWIVRLNYPQAALGTVGAGI